MKIIALGFGRLDVFPLIFKGDVERWEDVPGFPIFFDEEFV